jgi:hypothetical protein
LFNNKLIISESPKRPNFAGTAIGVSGTLIDSFFVTNLTKTLPSLFVGFLRVPLVVVVVVVVVVVDSVVLWVLILLKLPVSLLSPATAHNAQACATSLGPVSSPRSGPDS